MKIIAFGHRQGVGKDTAAKFFISYLRTQTKLSIQKVGFADKLKSICYDLYKWSGLQPGEYYEDSVHAHLKNTILPLIGKSPRQIWIDLGNGIRERVYEPTWYDYVFRNQSAQVLVIKDMRFPIEAEGILANKGEVYRIDRPVALKVTDGADDPLENFDKWTGVINNDTTLYDFHKKIIELAKRFII